MMEMAKFSVRKEAAKDAGDQVTAYRKYKHLVLRAKDHQWSNDQIISELEAEKKRIVEDDRKGDALFMEGLNSAKVAHMNAIAAVIAELRDA